MTNNDTIFSFSEVSFEKLKQMCKSIEKYDIENNEKDYLIISKNNWNKLSNFEQHMINCLCYVHPLDEKYMGSNDEDKYKAYIIPNEYFGIISYFTNS